MQTDTWAVDIVRGRVSLPAVLGAGPPYTITALTYAGATGGTGGGGGGGDVTSAAGSTDNAIARFDGTLGEWLAEWLPAHSRSVRPSTATSYAGHVRLHIDPLLGGVPLRECARPRIRWRMNCVRMPPSQRSSSSATASGIFLPGAEKARSLRVNEEA